MSTWPGNKTKKITVYEDNDETKNLSAKEIYELKERTMKGFVFLHISYNN